MCYGENIKNGIFINDIRKIILLHFFLDNLFRKEYYLKNITDFKILTETLNKIAEFERDIAKNG